jgi:hypothetical protein
MGPVIAPNHISIKIFCRSSSDNVGISISLSPYFR